MTIHEHWYDERGPDDAPVWLDADTASGWAQGYNAAVRACQARFTGRCLDCLAGVKHTHSLRKEA